MMRMFAACARSTWKAGGGKTIFADLCFNVIGEWTAAAGIRVNGANQQDSALVG
jgi:hypothetical protein